MTGNVLGNVRHFGWLRLAPFWCGIIWWKGVATQIAGSLERWWKAVARQTAGTLGRKSLGSGCSCSAPNPLRLAFASFFHWVSNLPLGTLSGQYFGVFLVCHSLSKAVAGRLGRESLGSGLLQAFLLVLGPKPSAAQAFTSPL